jgi:hypothetical protein
MNNTAATSAIPIGMPGWPEFAFCTPSIARPRMVFATTSIALLTTSLPFLYFSIKICKKPLAEKLALPYIGTVNGSDSCSVVQSAIQQTSGEPLSRILFRGRTLPKF